MKDLVRILNIIIIILLSTNICNAKTINDILEYSLKNNSEILLEKARLDKEKSLVKDGIVGFLPEIKAHYQRGRKKDDALGIERDNNLDKMSDQNIKSISINQPIFQGFRNLYKIKEIKSNFARANSYYEQRVNEILYSIVESYLNLYKLRKIASYQKENIVNHEKLLKLIKQRNRLGELSNSEVIIYETKLFNILLKNMEIKKDLFKAEQEYDNYIGRVDFNLELSKLDNVDFPNNEVEFFNQAVRSNSNLQKYKHIINSTKAILKQKRGSFSPNIELTASLSEQESVTYLNNRDLRTESLNLNISIPLFQKASEYFNLNKAHKEVVFAKNEYDKIYNDLRRDSKQIYKEYNFYKEMINENTILFNLTKDRITSLNEQIRLGVGDVIDLLNAKIELQALEEQQIEYQISYFLSYYRILLYLNLLNKGDAT